LGRELLQWPFDFGIEQKESESGRVEQDSGSFERKDKGLV